jgi:hypothetical protein
MYNMSHNEIKKIQLSPYRGAITKKKKIVKELKCIYRN